MAEYITTSDLTATVAQGLANISGYVEQANSHIDYIATSFGLTASGISTPIHFLIKEYAISYAYRSMYRDKTGANNLEATEDKYFALYQMHDKEVERLRPFLTRELFDGTASSGNEVSRTTVLYRC